MPKKATYKGEIAQEAIRLYPNASTNAIARLILKKYPLDFKNFQQARSNVRFYRAELNKKPKTTEVDDFKRSENEKKDFMRKTFTVPESDYKEIPTFIIPKAQNNILILSDIHIPYHDIDALSLAIQYGIEHKINAVYLNGDIIDMYQASRFIKDRRLRDLAGELEITREFLKMLKDTFNCPIYYKIGNHEERWENYLRLQAPELLGIPDFELSAILRFGEFGVTEIKGRQITKAGKLHILHGHEFGHSVFSPVNPARGLYMRAKESSIIGHHHQTSEHSEKSLSGEVVTTWSLGALCGLSPEYMPFNKWNHGFARVEVKENGNYIVHNKRIIKYKIM